jgi:hypothetical protein
MSSPGGNSEYPNSVHGINKNGYPLTIHHIPREGRFKPVPGNERPYRPTPSRGQRTHIPSSRADDIRNKSQARMKTEGNIYISRRRNNNTRRRQGRLNAYAQVKSARRSRMLNTRRGPKGAKGRN